MSFHQSQFARDIRSIVITLDNAEDEPLYPSLQQSHHQLMDDAYTPLMATEDHDATITKRPTETLHLQARL